MSTNKLNRLFLPLFLLFAFPLYAWKMESGTITLPATTAGSTTWQHVTFQQNYAAAPLVFAMPNEGSGYSADSPAALRVKNVSVSGFDIVQVEPQGSNGPHPEMTPIHYVAIDAGEHILPDGTKIIAGSVDTSKHQGKNSSGTKSWESVSFPSAFGSAPLVLGMIQTVNNEQNAIPGSTSVPWMVTAIQNVGTTGFDTALDMVKTDSGTISSTESIAYLAIDNAKQGTLYVGSSCQKVQYQTLTTAQQVQGWDDSCYSQSFGTTYANTPNVLGNRQTRNGGDGGWLRRCSLATDSVGITVDEDVAVGNRTHPVKEIAGLLVFSEDFVYDSNTNTLGCDLSVEYRMDECYWLDNSNGVAGDVKDETSNGFDATSYNSAAITVNSSNPPVCNHGTFAADQDQVSTDDTTAGNTNGGSMTVSFWVKLDQQMGGYAVILTKSKAWDWNDGWGFVNPNGSAGNTLRFYMNAFSGTNVETTLTTGDGWTHIAGVYDGNSLLLYKNGVQVGTQNDNSGITDSADPIRVAFDDPGDATLKGSVDEVKFWNKALSAAEINTTYQNERIGKNYDGTSRICPTCNAIVTANTWQLVGIPADFRNSNNPKTTVADIFGDDLGNNYGTDWRIYRRDYSTTDNNSSYAYLSSTDTLDFGKGYWLGSKKNGNWSENGAVGVDYNSTDPACAASRCVEIDLRSVTHDFAVDGDDGTGPYRYNMSGFVGKAPVDWADCRFIIDGTAYTPSEAEAQGYAAKQIWQYNPGNGNANGNGYTTCDDTMTSCLLEPYKGFWVELHGPTKGKSVKLLIPKE